MDVFEKNLGAIENIAKNLVYYHKGRFEVDELVNAAYLNFNTAITNNPRIIIKYEEDTRYFCIRVQLDMRNYIRKELGLRNKHQIEVVSMTYQDSPKDMLNGEISGSFETLIDEPGYKRIDNIDFIEHIIHNFNFTDTEIKILRGYYIDKKKAKDIARDCGLETSYISTKKKALLKKLRDSFPAS